jgi:hypothetical protein
MIMLILVTILIAALAEMKPNKPLNVIASLAEKAQNKEPNAVLEIC